MAASREGGFPKIFGRVHSETGARNRSLALLSGLSWVTLVLFYVANVDLETALLIPSGAAILLYAIGSWSSIKLLKEKGAKRLFPWISLAVSLVMRPFVGIPLLVSLVVAGLRFVYGRTRR